MRKHQQAYLVTAILAVGAVGCGDTTNATPNGDNNDNGTACTPCLGETVCVNGRCEDAFPRLYRITIGRVVIPTNKPDGSCWDEPSCGAPDPQVQIKVNDQKVGEFNANDDRNDVTINESIDVQLIAGNTLEIQLQDEDLVDSEPVLTCRYPPISADRLRDGNLGCSGNGASIGAQVSVPGQSTTP